MHKNGVKVLRVVTQASNRGLYGGPFDTARNQARIVDAGGFHVSLFAVHVRDDAPKATSGLRQRYFEGTYHLVQKPATLFSIRALRGLYSEVSLADVVHVSFSREAIPIIACVMALAKRRRLVVQTHGMIYAKANLAFRVFDYLVIRPILRSSDRIICLTANEVPRVEGLAGDLGGKAQILGNPVLPFGVAELNLRDGDEKPDDVLFLARLHPRKRVSVFAAAAGIALNEDLEGHYSVVGPDGGCLNAVIEAASAAGSRLRYEGAIPGNDVRARISRCRIFVLTSFREPWGNGLVAAIASGKPVVLTASSDLAAELMEFGCAIVIPDDDAPALARAVDSILRDPELEARLAARARAYAHEYFTDEKQLSRLQSAYGLDTA